MEFDLENPLVLNSKKEETEEDDDNSRALFRAESDQMPQKIFLESSRTNDFLVTFRREALLVASEANFSEKFDRSVLYLAINYMDRLIVTRQDLQQAKPWMQRLIVLACIALALKMKNLKFSAIEFRGEEGLMIFDARMIQRMELVVLDALNWRMRSITPFPFIPFFVSRLEIKDLSSLQVLKDRTTDIIFKSQNEIKLIEFRPSVVAAAALLVASNRLFELFPAFRRSILSCKYVNNDDLLRCFNIIKEMVNIEEYDEVSIEFDKSMECRGSPSSAMPEWPHTRPESQDVLLESKRIKRRRTNDRLMEECHR